MKELPWESESKFTLIWELFKIAALNMPITLIEISTLWQATWHLVKPPAVIWGQICCSKSNFYVMKGKSLFCSLLWQYKHSRLWRGQGESLRLFLYNKDLNFKCTFITKMASMSVQQSDKWLLSLHFFFFFPPPFFPDFLPFFPFFFFFLL